PSVGTSASIPWIHIKTYDSIRTYLKFSFGVSKKTKVKGQIIYWRPSIINVWVQRVGQSIKRKWGQVRYGRESVCISEVSKVSKKSAVKSVQPTPQSTTTSGPASTNKDPGPCGNTNNGNIDSNNVIKKFLGKYASFMLVGKN